MPAQAGLSQPTATFDKYAITWKAHFGESVAQEATAKLRSAIACRILMKIMYTARFTRPDLLRAIVALSTILTKWTPLCDLKLFRLIDHINGSVAWWPLGFVRDDPDGFELGLYSDADFAGDKVSLRRTSGISLALYDRHNFLPLSRQSTTQTAIRHSTVEAEVVSRAV